VIYATSRRMTDGQSFRMHRFIYGITDPEIIIDHADGNGLNNRRSNLRIATHSQNQANKRKDTKNKRSSIYKGVHFNTFTECWESAIYKDNKRIYLGRFDNQHEAALAYNRAALTFFGEFSRLNSVAQL
jgi:HNH endonuclease/AP2 domain